MCAIMPGDLRAEAVLEAGVHLRGDRNVVGECKGHVYGLSDL
jgi:hypothetical protein